MRLTDNQLATATCYCLRLCYSSSCSSATDYDGYDLYYRHSAMPDYLSYVWRAAVASGIRNNSADTKLLPFIDTRMYQVLLTICCYYGQYVRFDFADSPIVRLNDTYKCWRLRLTCRLGYTKWALIQKCHFLKMPRERLYKKTNQKYY